MQEEKNKPLNTKLDKKIFRWLLAFIFSVILASPYVMAQNNQAVSPDLLDKFGAPITSESKVDEKTKEPTEKINEAAKPVDSQVNQGSQSGQETSVADQTVTKSEDLVYLNGSDVDIKDLVKQISLATGTNFLIDDKLRGKVTIISEKPMTSEMAYQAFLSALQVMGYTTVMTPGGLIKIIQTKGALSEPVDFFTDTSPVTDKFITRIIQVYNISANELSTVVKGLVSKDGNMFAYPATNSLIVTDAGSNIDRILKIVKELDQEGPQEVIEIIPIQNADAKDIMDKITNLFEEEDAANANRIRTRRGRNMGQELDESPSISKVIADDRTNSVIILGSKRAIIKVKALIARLDTPILGVDGTIHVYYLKHANSKEMADVLSSLVSGATSGDKSGAGAKAKKTTAGQTQGSVELEGGVKVTADEGTNSLVITASPKDYQTIIDKVISKLDIPRRQVYLEAVIMELTVDQAKSTGFSANFGSIFNIFGESLTGFGSVLPVTPTTISSIAGAAGGLAGGVLSERSIDFQLGDGTSVSIPAVSAILQALQSNTDVNVLSTPSILTLDNEEAQIQIGQEVPTPSGTTVSSGVTTFNVTREDTGIILKITPQISESDTVRLKMTQEVTNVISSDENLGPTLTKRLVETVVVANNKQTIVIGGLIDDKHSVTINKTPLLGDIPVLGNLFKNKSVRKQKTNIIVFITPYVIRERKDYLEILRKKIEERNLFIDLNYGRSQREQIRESIRNHARELLEYKSAIVRELDTAPMVLGDTDGPVVEEGTANQINSNIGQTPVDSTKNNNSENQKTDKVLPTDSKKVKIRKAN